MHDEAVPRFRVPKTSPVSLIHAAGLGLALLTAGAVACGSSPDTPIPKPPSTLTAAELQDSTGCAGCHPSQFKEWSSSMHAYASEDPVFLALNQRAQRETNGALGDFCVQCHAPMAVRLGQTKDGLNLATVAPQNKGITCFFCHTAEAFNASQENNNSLTLSADPTMTGGIHDPLPNRVHASTYSRLADGKSDLSPGLCGPCHDIVTPAGAPIERTFKEWVHSKYSGQQSCAACHMPERQAKAADLPNAPIRAVHDHRMPGVDLAITDFPDREGQRAGVQALLDSAADAKLCVQQKDSGVLLDAVLTNRGTGHGFPSGSNQDRRAWVQLTAYKAGAVVYESGKVDDNSTGVSSLKTDSSLFLLRDRLYDEQGTETELFWKAVRYESAQLMPLTSSNPLSPGFDNSVHHAYTIPAVVPDRITMALHIRPMDFELLQSLVASGDLDPAYAAKVTTFTSATANVEWTMAMGFGCQGK